MNLQPADAPVIRQLVRGQRLSMSFDLVGWSDNQRRDFLRRTHVNVDSYTGRANVVPLVDELVRHLAVPPCDDARCGHPQSGPGHPRRGWVKVHLAGDRSVPDHWFCSYSCAAVHCRQAS